MEQNLMGKIVQTANIKNAGDLIKWRDGTLATGEIRHVATTFLVDTGAAMLCLTPDLIEQLGIREIGKRRAVTANGVVERGIFEPVQVEVFDRTAILEVMELPAGVPPLLGYLPLEALDLYPNPKKQCLEGNPQYDGKMIVDLL